MDSAVTNLWREVAAVAPLAWVAWTNPFLDDHSIETAQADEPCPEDLAALACIFGIEVCDDCATDEEES